MSEERLKQLLQALGDEEAAALLADISATPDEIARIYEKIEPRMKEELDRAAIVPLPKKRRIKMQWVYTAAACVAVVLAGIGFRYFGQRPPLPPIYPEETTVTVTGTTTQTATLPADETDLTAPRTTAGGSTVPTTATASLTEQTAGTYDTGAHSAETQQSASQSTESSASSGTEGSSTTGSEHATESGSGSTTSRTTSRTMTSRTTTSRTTTSHTTTSRTTTSRTTTSRSTTSTATTTTLLFSGSSITSQSSSSSETLTTPPDYTEVGYETTTFQADTTTTLPEETQ